MRERLSGLIWNKNKMTKTSSSHLLDFMWKINVYFLILQTLLDYLSWYFMGLLTAPWKECRLAISTGKYRNQLMDDGSTRTWMYL